MTFIFSLEMNSLNIKLIASDVLLCHTKEHSQVPGFGSCVPFGGALFPAKPGRTTLATFLVTTIKSLTEAT